MRRLGVKLSHRRSAARAAAGKPGPGRAICDTCATSGSTGSSCPVSAAVAVGEQPPFCPGSYPHTAMTALMSSAPHWRAAPAARASAGSQRLWSVPRRRFEGGAGASDDRPRHSPPSCSSPRFELAGRASISRLRQPSAPSTRRVPLPRLGPVAVVSFHPGASRSSSPAEPGSLATQARPWRRAWVPL
jgi:hypothetical protein